MRTPAALSSIMIALLTGCAGAPLVAINAPGFDAANTADSAMTLAKARDHLMHTRAIYRQAMADQLNVTQLSSSGLVVLGAAITGLAAGQAHRDAIVGASLIGGTSYAIGVLTLDRRRVLAFDAGIKALDCANDAVIPLDLDASARATLAAASKELVAARSLASARAAAVAAQLDDAVAPDTRAAAGRLLTATQVALADADRARKAADKFAADSREIGQRLQNTVNQIAAKVDGFIAQTVPDISAVQQVVGGLGGFASAFAPGAGVDKSLAAALARYKVDMPKANATRLVDTLQSDLKALEAADARLVDAIAAVNTALGNIDSAAVVGALKACNVADPILPLAIEPATLDLVAPTTTAKGFAISGGTKPYTVRLLDGNVDGLNIAFGGGFADTAQISASDKVPADTYRVLVADSSAGSAGRQLLTVTVGSKTGTTGTTPPVAAATSDGAATTANDALDALVRSLNGLGPQLLQGVSFSVAANGASLDAAAQRIDVSIVCVPPNPATKLKAGDVLDKLVAAAKGSSRRQGNNNPLRIKTANPNCIVG